MGQEFIIKSQNLEDKVNQLLPSHGGFQAGVDLSASTTIIPIVDLTESAEGSLLRSDLQRSFSFKNMTSTVTNNTTQTIINTTGFYRIFGTAYIVGGANCAVRLKDAVSSKDLVAFYGQVGADKNEIIDLEVFLAAGDSVEAFSSSTAITLFLATRQIADINGNLQNPT